MNHPPQMWPENSEPQWRRPADPNHPPNAVNPIFRQAPIRPFAPTVLPGASPIVPGPIPTFPYTHAPNGYPPQARTPTSHHHPPRRFSGDFSHHSFFDVPRGVPSTGNFNQDVRHHQLPPRRPAHWEDDPYSPSSLRDSLHRDHGNYHNHHNYRCYSGFRPDYGFPEPCMLNCAGHCHHPREVFQGSNHLQQSCHHWGCSHSPRRYSTLTYVGPPDQCPCHRCDHSNGHQNSSQSVANDSKTSSKTDQEQKAPDRKGKTEAKRRWGKAVKKWLTSRLPFIITQTASIPPNADNVVHQPEIAAGAPNEKRPTVKTSGIRRVSPNSVTTAGYTSKAHPLSPTSDTFVGSSSSQAPVTSPSLGHRSSHELLHFEQAQAIPRPSSTVSACQCLPPNLRLHPALHHDPFSQPAIGWDVTRLPSVIIAPEGFKTNFLDELATNPPVRHLFINAIGDFPLERCQGDPDPARSRNHERHLYQLDNSPEMVEKRTLPWPIRVTGSGAHGYITLNDVLGAIYLNFREYIPVEEHKEFTTERKRIIAAAYHLRQKVLEERRSWPNGPAPVDYVRPVFHEDLIEDGIMRCDYLGSQHMFRGFEMSPDQEGYMLFLGPAN